MANLDVGGIPTTPDITDNAITNISGGALPALNLGTGIGGPDPVKYATVSYEGLDFAEGARTADLQLKVGGLIFGSLEGNLFLGVGSDASDNSAGSTDNAIDGSITVGIPEPASIALIGLALAGLAGFRRR